MVLFEWLNFNTSNIAPDIGLAGNDVAAFYPLLAFMVCVLYFITNKGNVIGDYFQGEEEFEKTHDVKVIAQLGLRFFTSIANTMGVYNESTPEERDTREKEFVNFIKVAHQQYNMKKTGMHMKTELISGTGKSDSDERPSQDANVHNTDCNTNIPQISWWKARYTFSSICNKEEPEIVRYLPMSFYLEGTDANGSRVTLYGPVKKMKVETDRDVASAIPVDSIAWKMYLELVDTNWRQSGGTPGKNRVFKFVCSQQNDKCVFSTLVGSDGKAFNVFVSRFQLRFEQEPVSITTNVYRRFMADDMRSSDDTALALLSVHPGRDLLLSYLCRSMSLLDSTISWDKQKGNILLVGGASDVSQLPMEIHVRSPEPLNDEGDKFVAYPVKRIMIRYHSTPPDLGDMTPDAASIKAVQFLLPNNMILAQNVNNKKQWVVNDTTLHRDTTIDLLILNKTPVKGGKNRKPGMSGGASPAKTEGLIKFSDFPGVRQGFSLISIGRERQRKLRSEVDTVAQDWNDLRVNVIHDRITLKEILGDRRTSATVIGGTVALMFGWKMGTGHGITSLGRMTSFLTFATSLFAFIVGCLEYTDRLPDNLRPYEPVLFVLTGLSLLVSMATILYASRFVPEVSSTFYLTVFLGVLAAVMTLSFETVSPVPQSPTILNLKISILFVLASSLFLNGLELYKLSRKTASDVNFVHGPLPSTIGMLPNVGNMVMYASVLVLVIGLGTLEYRSAPDKCDSVIFERNRAHQNAMDNVDQRDDKQKSAYSYFIQERNKKDGEANMCLESQYIPFQRNTIFTNPKWSDYIPIMIMAVPLYLQMMTPSIGHFIGKRWPSRQKEEDMSMEGTPLATRRIEDGRTPRPVWFFKTMAGLLLVVIVCSLLLPYADASPAYCTHLRNMESENRDVLRQKPLDLNAKERVDMVKDEEWRYNCIPRETMTSLLVAGGLGMVVLLSYIAPAKKRFVPMYTNAIEVLCNLAYFTVASSVVIWSYTATNRTKILNFL